MKELFNRLRAEEVDGYYSDWRDDDWRRDDDPLEPDLDADFGYFKLHSNK